MSITWAQRRQWIVYSIFGAFAVALVAVIAIAIFYKTPTCIDNTQNQGETGVDCGGPCSHACVADERPPQVRFARAIASAPGRTDVIAYVDNPNADAAANDVHATVEVYDSNHALLARQTVTFDVATGSTVPVFVEGIVQNNPAVVTQTFFTIDTASLQWIRTSGKPTNLGVQDIVWQEGINPRVSATLVNPFAKTLANIRLIAVVFDANDQAIAASRTLVSTLPSQGTAPLIFTWNTPFSSPAARVEVVPVIPVTAP